MSNKTMKIRIITPERCVFEDTINQITLTVASGQITMLANHIPYTATLRPGEVLIKKGTDVVPIAVSGGFIEFSKNQLTVLADTAEHAEEIDLARAEEAKKRAEELKKQKISTDDIEYSRIAAMVEKELVRVKVAKKHRTKKRIHI